ncbi:MAG: Rossmann-like and DUF2520 domain-containing protein [Bacteroidia bacterium]|nr:Rossmann-like and DUF2520 domain-containing protein [Bacteroidia bacterium]
MPDPSRPHLPEPDPASPRLEPYSPLAYSPLGYTDLYGRTPPTHRGTFAIVGAGSAGYNLGYGLLARGYKLLHIVSRTAEEAQELGRKLNQPYVPYGDQLHALPPADWVLLTVPDDAIAAVAAELATAQQSASTYLHAAGSQPLELLKPLGANVGVLWPIQTLSRARAVELRQVPLFVEGTGHSQARLERLARELSDKVFVTDYPARLRLHIGAVFAANFVNHLVQIAGDLALAVHGADYHLFLPLLKEVVAKLDQLTPQQAQTGPAIRGDVKTIERHLDALRATDPTLAELYRLLTERIQGLHRG